MVKKNSTTIIGYIFETSIFIELIKLYGKDNIFYWRTKDKKEIDFILKKNNKLLPIKAKLNFASSNLSAIKYFLKHYNLQLHNIVALLGSPTIPEHIYPWNLIKLL
jgi:predicted AAA+ superfamily ATPase